MLTMSAIPSSHKDYFRDLFFFRLFLSSSSSGTLKMKITLLSTRQQALRHDVADGIEAGK